MTTKTDIANRKALAQDVLTLLETRRLHVSDCFINPQVDSILRLSLLRTDKDAYCRACAKGAFVVAAFLAHPDRKKEDVPDYGQREAIAEYTGMTNMTKGTLDKMEVAFERHRSFGGNLTAKQTQDSLRFGKRREDRQDILTAICRNILASKDGEFHPEKDTVEEITED